MVTAGSKGEEAAADPVKNAEAARKRKIEKMVEAIRKSKTWRGYKISGRVLDQYGSPVEGARVEVHSTTGNTVMQFLNQPRVVEYHVKTDANGMFKASVRGISPGVYKILKLGYVWLRERDKYPSTVVLPNHRTFWINPHLAAGDAVFHMRKKGPRYILLCPGLYLGFNHEDRTRDRVRSVRLLPFFGYRQTRGKDFEDYPYKMRKRLETANPFKSDEDRKLLMNLGYDLGVHAHADLDAQKWRVTLWMFRPEDGMFFTKNKRTAMAPETGYKREMEFSVPFKYRESNPPRLLPERRIEGRLFFRFFKPVVYATCVFSVTSTGSVRVGTGEYAVNPYGGRNLERDWGVPHEKLLYALEKEFETAILAADAGKPVKLPEEAKYRKLLEDILAKDKKLRKWYEEDNTTLSHNW